MGCSCNFGGQIAWKIASWNIEKEMGG